ncbi:MAG: hypothetical protein AABZ06_05495 [Bdellovibrionota bacterium]
MLTRKRLLICSALLFIAGACVLILPAMHRVSNCGGNSAALSACNSYAQILAHWEATHNGKRFSLSKVDPEFKRYLSDLPGADWVRSARLLAKTEDVTIDVFGPKRVIIVCDTAYDNVPQRYIGKAPMTHAVGYSNGQAGFITPEEYLKLDLSSFIDLQPLQSYNAEYSTPQKELPSPDKGASNKKERK